MVAKSSSSSDDLSAGVSLYVHVPFCARACPYCAFDFEVGRRPDVARWRAGLEREVARRFGSTRPQVRTVYIGGGTPSLLGATELGALHRFVRERFDCDAVEEWTVELNPEHTDPDLLAALADDGVGRVSIGTQSASPRGLKMLGRVHAAKAGFDVAASAVARGFSTSVDLLVGWPGQTDRELADDLAAARDSGAQHVSIYALTVEPGTPWERLERRGTRARPDDDRQAALLQLVHDELTAAGFDHYETASYARSGATSRHNLGYWSWRDVIAVGPSAASVEHGPAGVTRRTNPRGLSAWAEAPGAAETDRLGPEAAAAEGLWLGLRRTAGVDLEAFGRRFAAGDRDWVRGRVAASIARGNLRWLGDRVQLPPDRWLWHDEVGIALLSDAARDEAE